ncbi:MAG: acyl carrier protein [Burkholderiaceae bacterium]|jgi:acyl carrier protein
MSSLEQIQELLQKKFGIDPKTIDVHASVRDQAIDSLTLLEFIFAIEEHFDITFPEDRSDVDTLAGIAEVVDGIKSARAA